MHIPTYGIFASELPVHEGPATRLLHHLRPSQVHMIDFIYMQEVLVIQVRKAIQAIQVKKYKFIQVLQVMQVRLAHLRLNFRVIYCERVG